MVQDYFEITSKVRLIVKNNSTDKATRSTYRGVFSKLSKIWKYVRFLCKKRTRKHVELLNRNLKNRCLFFSALLCHLRGACCWRSWTICWITFARVNEYSKDIIGIKWIDEAKCCDGVPHWTLKLLWLRDCILFGKPVTSWNQASSLLNGAFKIRLTDVFEKFAKELDKTINRIVFHFEFRLKVLFVLICYKTFEPFPFTTRLLHSVCIWRPLLHEEHIYIGIS